MKRPKDPKPVNRDRLPKNRFGDMYVDGIPLDDVINAACDFAQKWNVCIDEVKLTCPDRHELGFYTLGLETDDEYNRRVVMETDQYNAAVKRMQIFEATEEERERIQEEDKYQAYLRLRERFEERRLKEMQ